MKLTVDLRTVPTWDHESGDAKGQGQGHHGRADNRAQGDPCGTFSGSDRPHSQIFGIKANKDDADQER